MRTWCLLASIPWQQAWGEPLFRDPTQKISDRVQDLMNLMTLEERIAQTWAIHNDHPFVLGLHAATGYGEQKLTGFTVSSADELLAKRNAYQTTVLNESRLRVPLSFYQETLTSGGPDGTGPSPRFAASFFLFLSFVCIFRALTVCDLFV